MSNQETANNAAQPAPVPPKKPLATEDLLSTHDMVGEWIRFADAKAAVVLTVAGAVASMLIPTFQTPPDMNAVGTSVVIMYWLSIALFAGWVVCLALACIWAFRCIDPFLDRGRHPSMGRCSHFHPAAISGKYNRDNVDDFIKNFISLGEEGFRHEVLIGLLIDSHISSGKYNRVTRAIRWLGISVVFGLVYGFMIQFR